MLVCAAFDPSWDVCTVNSKQHGICWFKCKNSMPCHACNSMHSFWITFYALKFRTKAWKYLFLLFFFYLPGTVYVNEHFCLRITNFHLYSLGRLQQCNMYVSMNSVQFMEKTMKSEFKGRGRVGLNRETIGRLEKGRGGGAGTLGNTCTQPSTPTSALSVFKNKPKTHSVSIWTPLVPCFFVGAPTSQSYCTTDILG